MSTYSVENGAGDASGEGMTRAQAMTAAKSEANRTGKTRYVVSTDPNEEAQPVAPDYPASDVNADGSIDESRAGRP